MKKLIKPIVCLVIMMLIIIPSSFSVFATDKRVFDDANLLKSSEEKSLEDEINSLRTKYHQDFVIVTTNDTKGKSSQDFADDYFDYNNFGEGTKKSGFLLLIDMDNRQVYISTKGSSIISLSDTELDTSLDNLVERVQKKNYFDTSKTFLSDMEKSINGTVTRDKYLKLEIFELLIAFAVAGVFFAVFVFAVKKKYATEGKACPYPFKEKGKVHLTRKDDIFVREYVTQTRISSSSSSGGGSSTHRSSSGSTHGGGGRSF